MRIRVVEESEKKKGTAVKLEKFKLHLKQLSDD
jgi:hypothetical protein